MRNTFFNWKQEEYIKRKTSNNNNKDDYKMLTTYDKKGGYFKWKLIFETVFSNEKTSIILRGIIQKYSDIATLEPSWKRKSLVTFLRIIRDFRSVFLWNWQRFRSFQKIFNNVKKIYTLQHWCSAIYHSNYLA